MPLVSALRRSPTFEWPAKPSTLKGNHTQMQRADIINAITAGEQAYSKNGSFILRTLGARGYVGRTLVGPAGPTALGRLWAETTGRPLPEKGFRMDQRTSHHGANEFIKDLRGKEHQVHK